VFQQLPEPPVGVATGEVGLLRVIVIVVMVVVAGQ
jgi:hypothetical protein